MAVSFKRFVSDSKDCNQNLHDGTPENAITASPFTAV